MERFATKYIAIYLPSSLMSITKVGPDTDKVRNTAMEKSNLWALAIKVVRIRNSSIHTKALLSG